MRYVGNKAFVFLKHGVKGICHLAYFIPVSIGNFITGEITISKSHGEASQVFNLCNHIIYNTDDDKYTDNDGDNADKQHYEHEVVDRCGYLALRNLDE